MKRLIIPLILVAVIAGGLGLRAFLLHDQVARLVLQNESGEQISDLSVKVWSHTFSLGTLPAGEKKEVSISDYSDSGWQLSGRWADGTPFSEQHGYITHGMSFDDHVVFDRNRKLTLSSKAR